MERSQTPKRDRDPKAGAKGANKSTMDKGKGKGAGVVTGQALNINNKKLKTDNSRGDKVSCFYFNSANGCSKGKACMFQHMCNVMTAKCPACETKHSAAEHTGQIVSD